MSDERKRLGRAEKALIWIVVTPVALGILVWLLVPPYANYTPRAKVSEVLLAMSRVRTEVEGFFDRNGRGPRDAAEGRIDLEPGSKYIREMVFDGARGEIRSVVKGIPEVAGKTVGLRFIVVEGGLKWQCFSPDIPDKHLPRSCHAR